MSLISINRTQDSSPKKPSPYKIYGLVPLQDMPNDLANSVPYGINFKTGLVTNLKEKKIYYYGQAVVKEYYRYVTSKAQTFEDLILKVEFEYIRNDQGYLTEKHRQINWLKENGSWGEYPKKEVVYITDEIDQIEELRTRRSNICSELKGLAKKFSTPELDLESKIPQIFEKYQIEKDSYVDAGSAKFRDAIAADPAQWLDEEIEATGFTSRESMTDFLSVGLR